MVLWPPRPLVLYGDRRREAGGAPGAGEQPSGGLRVCAYFLAGAFLAGAFFSLTGSVPGLTAMLR
jgi:hypothetical protein